MGREGLWSGKGPPVEMGGLGGGTLQTAVGARPTSGGSRSKLPESPCRQKMWSDADGVGRISQALTRFYLFNPVVVRLVPLKTHDFKRFPPDLNRSLPDSIESG